MKVSQIVEQALDAGVLLFEQQGKLGFKLKADAQFSAQLKQLVRDNKADIIAFLQKTSRGANESEVIAKAPSEQELPLSFEQQRLWFIDRLHGSSAHYNMSTAYDVEGDFQVEIAQQAFSHIVNRHRILRTFFVQQQDKVAQLFLPQSQLTIAIHDLSQLTESVSREQLNKLIAQHAQMPFDLSSGVLLNIGFVQLSSNKGVLLFNCHHIASDGYSMELLVKEFCVFYQQLVDKKSSELPPLPIQYGDYAYWQQQKWQQGKYDQALDYWTSQLSESPPLHGLSLDKARPAVKQSRAKVVRSRLNADAAAGLNELARRYNLTPFMLLHSALALVLSRHSNSSDIVIGTVVANRSQPQLEQLIGFFVNTLALRVNTKHQSLNEYFAHVRQVHLDGLNHQQVPFDQVVERLNITRHNSYTPLVQIMLAFGSDYAVSNEQSTKAVDVAGVLLKPRENEHFSAKFDLDISVDFDSEGLCVNWVYDVALFEHSRMEHLAEHFSNILLALTELTQEDQTTLLAQISNQMMSAEQHRLLAQKLSGSPMDYPQNKLLHEFFQDHAQFQPSHIALQFNEQSISYGLLNEKANALAHYLQALGLQAQELVGIYFERSIECYIAILAVLKAGGAYVPLDPGNPASRIEYMVADTQMRFMLTSDEVHETAKSLSVEHLLVLDHSTLNETLAAQPKSDLAPVDQANGRALAYVIYTSGSTGMPKGVMVEHQSIANLLVNLKDLRQVTEQSQVLQFLAFGFDAGAADWMMALSCGATMVICPESMRQDPEKLQQLMIERRITHATFTPNFLTLLDPDLPYALENVVIGGESFDESLATKWGSKGYLYNAYGPTEATVYTTLALIEPNGPIVIGKALSNVSLYVLDEHLQSCPQGAVGQLFIGGECLARGYLNQPELTAQQFITRAFDEQHAERIYQTGDLVRMLSDGNLQFIGRVDDQVKIRGFRVELGEIQNSLNQCEFVVSSYVLLGKDTTVKGQLIAYVQLQDDVVEPTQYYQQIKQQLSTQLPAHMVPKFYVALEQWPTTNNGKVDTKALPPVDISAIQSDFEVPKSDIEIQLAQIWSQLLSIDVEQISVNADFFALGGHSLLSVRLVGAIRQQLSVEVAVKDVFAFPSIHQMAYHLETLNDQSVRPGITALERTEQVVMSFAQERVWFIDRFQQGSANYNMPLALKVQGDFDLSVVSSVLTTIVERHEILRSVYSDEHDKPVQIVLPSQAFEISSVDLSDLSQVQQSQEVERINHEDENLTFDLENDLMLRAQWLVLNKQVGERSGILLICMHHIASDGWSIGVLTKEFIELYRAFSLGQENPLVPLPIQYADFALWQRRYLQGEIFEQQLTYWQNQLSDLPVVHDLPLDFARPEHKQADAGVVCAQIPTQILTQIQKLAQSQGVTLFMLVHGVFAILLSRYGNNSDVVIGTPVANRLQKELDPLIGFFLNTLVLRTQCDGVMDFTAYLESVKQVNLDAQANQDIPFEHLVDKLKVARSLQHTPLFQIMLAMDSFSQPELDLEDLKLSTIEHEEQLVKFDIELNIATTDAGLKLRWLYDSSLFAKTSIERLNNHLICLLKAVVADPHRKLHQLPMMSPEQVAEIVNKGNDTDQELSQTLGVHRLFETQAAESAADTALVFNDESVSYKQLNQQANRLAWCLREKGVCPGTTVAVCVERSINMVVALLAVLKAGGAYVPLDPGYPVARLNYILLDVDAHLVLTESSIEPMLDLDHCVPTLLVDAAALQAYQVDNLASDNESLEQLAYIIYTSGSTGKPKGVKINHLNLVNFVTGLALQFGQDEQSQTWLALTSISFDISVLELFWTLINGQKVVIQPERAVPVSSVAQKPLDFSLFYFAAHDANHQGDKYKLLLEGARFADDHGLQGVWVPERHFAGFGDPFPNPSVAAAAVAATTQNVTIRAGSVVLPLHDPIRVAEEWSMVDNLSNGRVEVSIASGWHPNDFVLAPDNFAVRHQNMQQNIEVLKSFWQGQSITRTNGVGEPIEVNLHPKPVQPNLPVWITAAGHPDTFKYAGSIGANVLTHLLGQSVDELAEKIAIYRQALKDHGFDPKARKVALMLHSFVNDDASVTRALVEPAFKQYLRHSANLLKPMAEETGLDFDKDLDALIDLGFDRFYHDSGLFGTAEQCLTQVEKLQAIDIDEIACLLDFGIDDDVVLSQLPHLSQLQQLHRQKCHQLKLLARRQHNQWAPTELIERHQVTHMQCTPAFLQGWCTTVQGRQALSGLRQLMVGGEAMPVSLVTELQANMKGQLFNMYGPTETTVWSAVSEVSGSSAVIGVPLANTRFYILDEYMNPVPQGVSGELCIAGLGVSPGYFNRDELTKQNFVDNPFELEGQLYRTGDLVRRQEDLSLRYLGRIDNQMKIQGVRIEAGEIENALGQIDGVNAAAVTAYQGHNEHQQMCAFVCIDTDLVKTDVEHWIKEALGSQLPMHLIPHRVQVLQQMPLTPNGKIDKKSLPTPSESPTFADYVPPSGETEQTLAHVWAQVLEIDSDQISREANFFEIGGRSLLALQLVHAIENAFKVKIPLSVLFEIASLAALAAEIELLVMQQHNKRQLSQQTDHVEMEF